jgi:hypothetical protein
VIKSMSQTRSSTGAVVALVGDGDAIGEEFVEAAVVVDQVLAFAADDLAQGFVDRVGGDVGVDAGEGARRRSVRTTSL